ncbi:H-NS histone family protein [Gammaproteobacteria bacterium]|nr:H-NS histone family protein [Gammaproteobacteria bacterium]
MRVSSKKEALERQLAQIERELKSIERSAAFKREKAINRALTNLMKKHGCSKNDLISILQGTSATPVERVRAANSKARKPRKLKIFKNPNTGETVETRGGNHRVLKAWKSKYELTNIDEWLVGTKD